MRLTIEKKINSQSMNLIFFYKHKWKEWRWTCDVFPSFFRNPFWGLCNIIIYVLVIWNSCAITIVADAHTTCHMNYYNLSPKICYKENKKSQDHQPWSRFDLFWTLIWVHSVFLPFVESCWFKVIERIASRRVRIGLFWFPVTLSMHDDIASFISYAWRGRQVLKSWHSCSAENLLGILLGTFRIGGSWNSIIFTKLFPTP